MAPFRDLFSNPSQRLPGPAAIGGDRCPPSLNELLRFDQRRKGEVLEDRCFEERFAACIAPQFRNFPLHRSIAGEHFRNGCNILRLTEDVSEGTHEPFDGSVVNLWIDAVDVACGPLRAVPFALKYVLRLRDVRAMESETQLYRHVEPRNTPRYLDTRQVVNRHFRFIDQSDDCAKAALIRNCKSGVNRQPKLSGRQCRRGIGSRSQRRREY
jgi:hypothetical protein